MKKILFSAVAVSALPLCATPVVSNVTIEQNGSRTVKVAYDLSEDAVVTTDFLTNATADVWASVGLKNVTHVWGDANKLVKGAGRHYLYWAPEKAWKAQFGNEYTVKANVKAWATNAPPDYMVVDLTTANAIFYYETAEQVPGGVTNETYKTDKLLMRKIPAKGITWRMGSPTGEVGKSKAEGDWNGWETTHYVTLTEDFYLGVYELTRKQCIDRIGSGYWVDWDVTKNFPLRPVAGDSYRGGVCYTDVRGTTKTWPANGHEVDSGCVLGKLRASTGIQFDLPTEAQWEFACRAGVSAALCNGQELTDITTSATLDDIAWYKGNADGRDHDVGELAPNGFGLYDMLGNLGEFCLDRITGRGVSSSESVINPPGPSDETPYRVVRGGGAFNDAFYARSAFRQTYVKIVDGGTKVKSNVAYRLWAPAEAK